MCRDDSAAINLKTSARQNPSLLKGEKDRLFRVIVVVVVVVVVV